VRSGVAYRVYQEMLHLGNSVRITTSTRPGRGPFIPRAATDRTGPGQFPVRFRQRTFPINDNLANKQYWAFYSQMISGLRSSPLVWPAI